MRIEEFDYHLPEELIAQRPIDKRSASRLMVLNRDKKTYHDRMFSDIVSELRPGDALVINNTRVIPVRLFGRKIKSGGHFEVLLTRRLDHRLYEAMVHPGRRAGVGRQFEFGDGRLKMTVEEVLEDGVRIVSLDYEGDLVDILNDIGEIPLPKYIHEELEDAERYQTVYSKHLGSAAAPTAGLHFTPEILDQVKAKGVQIVELTLHVGLGTFAPVHEEDITDHHMHEETYSLSEESAATLRSVQDQGGRIIAVGTTSVRTLESIANKYEGQIQADTDATAIFIYPGYQFQAVDAMITNFHTPRSTLLMLVSAFAGRDFILEAYQHAIDEKYRFFSFGDAMFIQ